MVLNVRIYIYIKSGSSLSKPLLSVPVCALVAGISSPRWSPLIPYDIYNISFSDRRAKHVPLLANPWRDSNPDRTEPSYIDIQRHCGITILLVSAIIGVRILNAIPICTNQIEATAACFATEEKQKLGTARIIELVDQLLALGNTVKHKIDGCI